MGQRTWYEIKNQADAEETGTEVLIYDAVGEYGVSARDFIRDISSIRGTLTLRMNTEGGEVFDGLAIYSALKQRKGKVRVVIDSLAASIGSVIAMAADEVVMAKNARLMIHEAQGVAMGDASDMAKMGALLDDASDNIAGIYAERTGTESGEWRERMRAETWIGAEEAVELGLADEILGTPKKSRVTNKAYPVHHTATEDSPWDGPAAVAAMPNDPETLRYCHAWTDAEGDPENKSTYKFPHHRREGGPANLAACRNGLARLTQADIPEADRAGVERHLRAHLEDAQASDKIDLIAFDPEEFRRAMKEAAAA
jgi:ATP-dependent protease ClpP protease subunit